MTDWEQRYRSGDTPWEKGTAHPALVAWLARNPVAGRILVPGCGSGHDVRALAATGAEVVGFDLAPSAVEAAERFPRIGKETYVCGDFFAPPEDWTGTFDGIFEHTCFCAIPPDRRSDYAASVAKLLKSGGHLLAIFYLDPDHDGGGPPYGCSLDELDERFLPRFRIIEEQGDIPTFPGREGREILRVFERTQSI